MGDVAVQLEEKGQAEPAQLDATFAELVWAHAKWAEDLHADDRVRAPIERRYRAVQSRFVSDQGRIHDAYWSIVSPSAVALTVKPRPRLLRWLGFESTIRFHHETDWVTKSAPVIAGVMEQCETLAIRIGEVLRGTSQRIAMQWVLAVASHLLGFLDRTDGRPGAEAEARVAEAQLAELAKVELYYRRAGGNAARLVYFWGMLIGAFLVAALAPVMWGVLSLFGVGAFQEQTFFACYAAGAVGALVSVMARMTTPAKPFALDYEVGRQSLRRIGSLRPWLGAIFGVVTYLVLESGILKIAVEKERAFFYYGTLAFISGFSERWTRVLLGGIEATTLGGRDGQESRPPADDTADRS